MRTHEPELTGKEKRAVKAWQGENAEKVQFFFHTFTYFLFFLFSFLILKTRNITLLGTKVSFDWISLKKCPLNKQKR